uniref:Uncharacterized protein n=1 Tax=viral metagenome TaxID=1070528 RepID=A0A6M3IXC7_9ZZZZ
MNIEPVIIPKIEAVLKKYRESWGYGKKIDYRNFAAHDILKVFEDAGYLPVEEVTKEINKILAPTGAEIRDGKLHYLGGCSQKSI